MKRVTLVWIFKKTYNMTVSSARTDRFGHFEMVDVIAKTTSRDSLGGIFETLVCVVTVKMISHVIRPPSH